MQETEIKLTQYSHGAGCGCKISPSVLDRILHSFQPQVPDPKLLVGNDTRDDAAVYDLGNGDALISTTDFFMPIVDDAFDFGRIASANAISDVYAMGGKPILAIAILGWPIDKLAPEIARKVLEGSRAVCAEAGITLAGGHSIDSPEPIFGLAVNGIVSHRHLKKNASAKNNHLLYLTKALGVGILTTAQKKSLLKPEHSHIAPASMVQLNKAGELFGTLDYVSAMTDVTGFGLLGHLSELCEGSGLQANIRFQDIPVLNEIHEYLALNCIPGGTQRNLKSYGHKIESVREEFLPVLADPQTSGGLLVAVDPHHQNEFEEILRSLALPESCCKPFGELHPVQNGKCIQVVD
ncbi:MAG TPA: selenide, water dikinase SelD [Chitinophagaceae bacterium]|nr:selenide, water dikinase SelD [Chitinophagaceae bacterium]HNF70970.1 selenide, water dikinase SelD [Chitinophagaceae bacterium]